MRASLYVCDLDVQCIIFKGILLTLINGISFLWCMDCCGDEAGVVIFCDVFI